ncbi:MAG: DUF481 domain-containing protein, partial [Polyangiales bacterium]
MTRISGHLGRSVAWTSLLVAALFHVFPNLAAAEEPPTEALPASGVDTAAEVQTEATAGSDTVADMITAPAGTSAAPAQAAAAIDSVQESMAKIQLQAASGVGDAYVLEFGDSFDWVQLVSGEWIKGNIARMRNDKVEFDSDKLDMLYLDFADVSLVHSPQVNTYVFDDGASATGPAVITAEQVIVQTDEGTKTFPRSELESIVEGEKERDWWSMKLRFGLTLNKGNTDQLTYDINFNTRREDEVTLLDLNYNTTFGRTGGTQNVNRHLGEFLFNVFLGSRWWVTPAFGQLFNDRFQNIRFRATPAAGAGVHIIDAPKAKWDFVTGMGYQYLNYKDASQLTSGSNPQHDGFIPLFTYADFDITGDIDLTLSWLTNLVFTTIGNTNHTGRAELAVELTKVIDLDIAFLYLRTEQPAPPPDPVAPAIKKNDYQLVV